MIQHSFSAQARWDAAGQEQLKQCGSLQVWLEHMQHLYLNETCHHVLDPHLQAAALLQRLLSSLGDSFRWQGAGQGNSADGSCQSHV